MKECLVSKYENKINRNTVPLCYFCVSHSAQQDIIITMCIAVILLARVNLRKRLKMNFGVKKNKHTFTNIYLFTIITINSILPYTVIHKVLLLSFVT